MTSACLGAVDVVGGDFNAAAARGSICSRFWNSSSVSKTSPTSLEKDSDSFELCSTAAPSPVLTASQEVPIPDMSVWGDEQEEMELPPSLEKMQGAYAIEAESGEGTTEAENLPEMELPPGLLERLGARTQQPPPGLVLNDKMPSGFLMKTQGGCAPGQQGGGRCASTWSMMWKDAKGSDRSICPSQQLQRLLCVALSNGIEGSSREEEQEEDSAAARRRREAAQWACKMAPRPPATAASAGQPLVVCLGGPPCSTRLELATGIREGPSVAADAAKPLTI